jgi:hypothetical protein
MGFLHYVRLMCSVARSSLLLRGRSATRKGLAAHTKEVAEAIARQLSQQLQVVLPQRLSALGSPRAGVLD